LLTAAGTTAAHVKDPAALGKRVAQDLLAKGAQRLIANVRDKARAVAAP
jgi:hypothetical protein